MTHLLTRLSASQWPVPACMPSSSPSLWVFINMELPGTAGVGIIPQLCFHLKIHSEVFTGEMVYPG